MLKERVAPQSEVIRAIVLADSPCCEVPAPPSAARQTPAPRAGLQPATLSAAHTTCPLHTACTLPPRLSTVNVRAHVAFEWAGGHTHRPAEGHPKGVVRPQSEVIRATVIEGSPYLLTHRLAEEHPERPGDRGVDQSEGLQACRMEPSISTRSHRKTTPLLPPLPIHLRSLARASRTAPQKEPVKSRSIEIGLNPTFACANPR